MRVDHVAARPGSRGAQVEDVDLNSERKTKARLSSASYMYIVVVVVLGGSDNCNLMYVECEESMYRYVYIR